VLPHLGEPEAAELARAVEALVRALHPERIYVFGSQVRGSAAPDSDVDLAVIVPASGDPGYRRDQAAYAAIGWHRLPLDVLVLTRAEFEDWRAVAGSLPATVVAEGRLLYAAAAQALTPYAIRFRYPDPGSPLEPPPAEAQQAVQLAEGIVRCTQRQLQ
jgi:predicted nucleotidyltransferase